MYAHACPLDTVGNFLRGWPRTALLGYFLHAEWVRIGLGCWPLAGFLAFIRGRPIDDVTPNDVDHNNDKSFEAIDSTRDMSDGKSIDLYLLSLSPKSCPTACDLDPPMPHLNSISNTPRTVSIVRLLCMVLSIFVLYLLCILVQRVSTVYLSLLSRGRCREDVSAQYLGTRYSATNTSV